MAVKSAEVSVSASIQRERQVLSEIQGCSDIVMCYGDETTIGSNCSIVYNMLMEYASGGTLADRINKSGGRGLPESETKVFARSILRGLRHIHGVGYVHCDLKPDNILLFPNGRSKGVKFRAKIGDFGLAKRRQLSKKRKFGDDEHWQGTPIYLSPEAVSDNVQDCMSDIWAFGCTVLEMLTGKPPWHEEKDKNANEILYRIRERCAMPQIPKEVSSEARSFLKGCFTRKPTYRFTAEMLLNHPFLEGLEEEEEDYVEEDEEVEDLSEGESILLASDSDDDCCNNVSFGLNCNWSLDSGCYDDWQEADEIRKDAVFVCSEEDTSVTEDKIKSTVTREKQESDETSKGAVCSFITTESEVFTHENTTTNNKKKKIQHSL